jgi:biotin transport system substrate-specific component
MNMQTNALISKNLLISRHSTLTQALWVTGFALATAIGARIEIPHQPIPFTLQTLFVLLAGAMLGARNGALSMVLYLAIGALGAPVFSLGGFGLMKFVGPTGGYLIAFPVVAAIVGLLTENYKSYVGIVVSMFVGLMVLFLAGTAHLYAFYIHDFGTAFNAGFMIFSVWDLVKLFAAASMYFQVAKRWPRVS